MPALEEEEPTILVEYHVIGYAVDLLKLVQDRLSRLWHHLLVVVGLLLA